VLTLTDALAHTPSERLHLHRALKTFFNWASMRSYISQSPMERLALPTKQKSRDRFLTEDELAKVWKHAKSAPYPFGIIVQLLILTGQRYGEIANLRRSFIQNDLITWPAEVTKNSTEHSIPITPMVAEILKSVPQTNSEAMFPTFAVAKTTQRFRSGIDIAHWTLHDLRRTFSTNQAKLGTPPDVTEAILNHKSGSRSQIQRVYDRFDRIDPMRKALVAHEELVAKLSKAR
jgi:integrase